VAGVGCERKKKKLSRREKGWKEKRESRSGCLVVMLVSCGVARAEGLMVALVGS